MHTDPQGHGPGSLREPSGPHNTHARTLRDVLALADNDWVVKLAYSFQVHARAVHDDSSVARHETHTLVLGGGLTHMPC